MAEDRNTSRRVTINTPEGQGDNNTLHTVDTQTAKTHRCADRYMDT